VRHGTIRRMKKDAGFGFIRPEGNTDGTQDHFFHRSTVRPESAKVFEQIDEGDRVTFEIEQSPKGPRACDVRVL
jgi:CspA family cold shock protein